MKKMEKYVLPVVIGMLLVSCTNSSSKSPGDKGNSSGTKSVNIAIPDKKALSTSAPQIETLMNGVMIVTEPLTPNCNPNARRTAELKDYSNAVGQASIYPNCDYNITIAFGNMDPGGSALKAVYLQNNTPYLIRKEDTANQSTINAVIHLQIQPAGAALGLKAPAGGTVNSGFPSQTGGSQGAATVSLGSKDIQLTGRSGPTTLSQLFKGELMVIDLSAVGCQYCVQGAQRLDSDRNMQALLNGTKCSHVTVIDSLSDWTQLGFGTSSFTGQNSFESSVSATSVGRQLGVNISGTPTYLVMDRNGNLIPTSDENSEPTDIIQSRCR